MKRLLVVLAALTAVVQSRAAPRKQEKEGPPVDEPIDTGISFFILSGSAREIFFENNFSMFSIFHRMVDLRKITLVMNHE